MKTFITSLISKQVSKLGDNITYVNFCSNKIICSLHYT